MYFISCFHCILSFFSEPFEHNFNALVSICRLHTKFVICMKCRNPGSDLIFLIRSSYKNVLKKSSLELLPVAGEE
jgi:hypothetical protein